MPVFVFVTNLALISRRKRPNNKTKIEVNRESSLKIVKKDNLDTPSKRIIWRYPAKDYRRRLQKTNIIASCCVCVSVSVYVSVSVCVSVRA